MTKPKAFKPTNIKEIISHNNVNKLYNIYRLMLVKIILKHYMKHL